MNNKFVDKAMIFFEKINQNRYLSVVSKAMVMTIPATITGALCTLITNLPFDAYQTFLSNTGLNDLLAIPVLFTTNILALIVVYFVAFNIVKSFELDGTVAAVLAIVCFLIFTPLGSFEAEGRITSFISFEWIGAKGMFVGIVLGLVIGRLYALFMIKRIYIRMPSTVPAFVEKSFASVIPFFCICFLSAIGSWLFTFTRAGNIHEVIYNILQVPLQNLGGSIGGVLVAYVAINLFWWFGLHGKAIVFAVVAPIWASMGAENLLATNAGMTPPHLIDMGFTTIFMEIGGAGCILGLAILFIFLSKSEHFKSLGKITMVPTFFGINEPITFGTSVVLNPTFLIPTILTPLVTGIIGYASIVVGFVPRMSGASLPTGVPSLFNAIILAGWNGLIVQIICIVIAVAIYYPFFRMADMQALKEENNIKKQQDIITE